MRCFQQKYEKTNMVMQGTEKTASRLSPYNFNYPYFMIKNEKKKNQIEKTTMMVTKKGHEKGSRKLVLFSL